jgi:hypothetical protein
MAVIFSSVKKVTDYVKTVNLLINQAESGIKPDAELIAIGQKATATIPNTVMTVSEEEARKQMAELMASRPISEIRPTTPTKR